MSDEQAAYEQWLRQAAFKDVTYLLDDTKTDEKEG
jgi:hypothetical protein